MSHRFHIGHLPGNLPELLRQRLKTFARLRALWSALAEIGAGLMWAGVVVILTCAFDRFVDVPGLWRLPFTWLAGVTLVTFAFRALYRWVRPANYDEVAHALDRAHGDRRDHLRSSVDFARRDMAAHALAGWTLDRAVHLWTEVRPSRLANRRKALLVLCALVVMVAGVAAVSLVPDVRAGLLWKRFVDPRGNYMRPTATWFEVDPLPAAPLHGGDDYAIRARLRGRAVANPSPITKITYADGTSLIRKLQAMNDGSWQITLTDIRQPFSFVVSMERVRSAVHAVRVLPRPTLAQLTVTYYYPKYTNLKKKTETLPGRTITALEGTKVRIDLTCNVPMREAAGIIGDETKRFTVNLQDAKQATCYLFLAFNTRMDLKLLGANGLTSAREAPLQLRVIPDSPPTINMTGSFDQREFYVSEIIEAGYRAQDDLGLMEVLLRSGQFEQEVELPSYGAKEAQGTIQIPLSMLVKPGDTALKLRMVARDGKGQAAFSREATLKIAIDSYDRQLRMARNSLTGKYNGNDLANCGYPMLERHQNKLASIAALGGRLTMLKETLAERAKPGEAEKKVVQDIRGTARSLLPSFDYARSSDWRGEVYDWLSNARLTHRLRTVVRDSVCGGELALNGAAITNAVEQALASDNPKAALNNLTPLLASASQAQSNVLARLTAYHQMIQVELAGYLADSLSSRLERATPADWGNNDFVLAAQSAATELDGILTHDLTSLADTGTNSAFRRALAQTDAQKSLEQLRPLLRPLATNLVAAALKAAADPAMRGFAIADFQEANKPLTPGWVDMYGLWTVMQTGGAGSDAIAQLQNSMRFLQLYGEGAFRPVGDGNPAVRDQQETAVQLYMTLARMRADAEALRLGLVNGYYVLGKPEVETHWIRLREGYLDLLRFKEHPAVEGGLRNEVSSLTASALSPLQHWVPGEKDAVKLGLLVKGWGDALQVLAVRVLPAAQNSFRTLDADLNGRWPSLAAGIAACRRDIAVNIAALESVQGAQNPELALSVLSSPLWPLKARMLGVEQALLNMLDVGEACRLQAAGGAVDLERLAAAHVFLRKGLLYMNDNLMLLGDQVVKGLQELKGTQMSGKIKEYRELDRILQEVAGVLTAMPAPDVLDQKLKENMLLAGFDREKKQLRAALAMEAGLADKTNVVQAILGDRSASAAVWGEVGYQTMLLQSTLQAGKDLTGLKKLAESALAVVQRVDPLPKDMQALPDILTGCTGDLGNPERRKQMITDLNGVLEDLRPLAQPSSAALGKEQAQRDLLAVNGARMALVVGRPDLSRMPLYWSVTEMEWNRRRVRVQEGRMGIGGLALGAGEDLENLKLPRHLYLELKRAREHAMPELFKDRSYQYLNGIMERAR